MNRKRRAVIEGNEISEIHTYTLGGYPQKVLIEGKSADNPVLLFLHGGPGSPFPFSEGCRGMYPEYTGSFIMVYWDQLGCGINHCTIGEDFTPGHFVDMTVDLIRAVKKDYPDRPLFLFAVSWGSFLAAKAAERVPELLTGVITYGQILHGLAFSAEVFEALHDAPLKGKERRRLEEIEGSKEHTVDDGKYIMNLVRKYTEGYQVKSDKPPLSSVIFGILGSPDYRWKDFMAALSNSYRKNKSLLKELLSVDLSEALENCKVTYRILQGSKDLVTPTAAVREFCAESGNEHLTLRVIDNSGHIPGSRGMEEIWKEMLLTAVNPE